MRIASTALVLGVIFGACGGTGAPAAVTTPTTTPTATPTATPTPTVGIATNSKLGKILVAANQMTLYTFKPDIPNTDTSKCTGGCATTWPPFTISGEVVVPSGLTAKFATFVRADTAAKQVTYNGMPLYLYANDKAAGDANGEGLGNNWFTIKNP